MAATLVFALAVVVEAQTWDCGKTKGTVTATLSGGTLKISGKGPMASWGYDAGGDYDVGDFPPPWSKYFTSISNVVIENGVTSIGDYAFGCNHCGGSQSPNLKSVTIPNSVTTIGSNAFFATGLTSLTIPNSVTSIGPEAFSYCGSLSSVTIGSGLKSIASGVFSNCENLSSVTIGNGVKSIGDHMFEGLKSLTSVKIPNGVTSIGRDALSGTGLISVAIPNSVTSIGTGAFEACEGLVSIEVANDNANYSSENGVLFNKSKTVLLQYPGGKKGDYTIPNSITSIADNAFSYCYGLTSLTIPNSIASIGIRAFSHLRATSVISLNPTPPNIKEGRSVFGNIKMKDVCLYVPSSSIDAYRKAAGWNEISCIKDAAVAGSAEDVFQRNALGKWNCGVGDDKSAVIAVLWNDGTFTIKGKGAMADYNIQTVQTYAPWLFNTKNKISNVVVEDGVTSIGKGAFFSCHSLTSITIPNSVTSIGEQAFAGCSSLKSVTIPNSVTSIGQMAFGGCKELASVAVLNSTPPSNPFAFIGIDMANACLYVPSSSIGAYRAATGWNMFTCIKDIAEANISIPTVEREHVAGTKTEQAKTAQATEERPVIGTLVANAEPVKTEHNQAAAAAIASTSGGLTGAWVLMEGENKGESVIFQSNGRAYGFDVIAKGCSVEADVIHDGAGNIMMAFKYGAECDDEFAYEKVGNMLFIKSVDGKPLKVSFDERPKSPKRPTATTDDKWSFEILEDGKYLNLNGMTLKRVDNIDALMKEKAEKAKQKAKEKEDEAKVGDYNIAWENATIALKKDDLDGVISYASEAIRLLPDRGEGVYALRGSAYLSKKDYDKAIEDINQMIRLNPNDAMNYKYRADAYAGKKDYDNAIADLGKALQLNPKDAEAYNSRGWWLAQKGDYDRAIADCNIAINLKPDFAHAYDSRGFAYAGKKDYEKAISDYTDAIRYDRNIESSYLGRGNAYKAKGDYTKAISDFNDVLRISKDEEEIGKAKAGMESSYLERGNAYNEKGEYKKAFDDFNKVLQTSYDEETKASANAGLERAKTSDPKLTAMIAKRSQPYKFSMSVGGSAFFAGDFGGQGISKKTPERSGTVLCPPGAYCGGDGNYFDPAEVSINTIPWTGSGINLFFDAVFAEIGFGLTFANGNPHTEIKYADNGYSKMVFGGIYYKNDTSYTNKDVKFSITTMNIGILLKLPVSLNYNMAAFPTIGVDYFHCLSAVSESQYDGEYIETKFDGKDGHPKAGDLSHLWLKAGYGFDHEFKDALFLRLWAFYGIGFASKFYSEQAKKSDYEANTTLSHGFTIKLGVGYKL